MTPQRVHSPSLHLRSRGFTLIEMMVVVGILSVLAALAVGGFRQNEASLAYQRFVDDVHGGIVAGRNAAIDDQTRVRVTLQAAGLRVEAFDPETEQWRFIRISERDGGRGEGPQSEDNRACLLAMVVGISTPSQTYDHDAPSATCLTGSAVLTFEPDGRFSTNAGGADNVGVSLWVGDRRMTGQAKYSLIQLFPGGYIRVFRDVRIDQE